MKDHRFNPARLISVYKTMMRNKKKTYVRRDFFPMCNPRQFLKYFDTLERLGLIERVGVVYRTGKKMSVTRNIKGYRWLK